jgi:hypothetical protein
MAHIDIVLSVFTKMLGPIAKEHVPNYLISKIHQKQYTLQPLTDFPTDKYKTFKTNILNILNKLKNSDNNENFKTKILNMFISDDYNEFKTEILKILKILESTDGNVNIKALIELIIKIILKKPVVFPNILKNFLENLDNFLKKFEDIIETLKDENIQKEFKYDILTHIETQGGTISDTYFVKKIHELINYILLLCNNQNNNIETEIDKFTKSYGIIYVDNGKKIIENIKNIINKLCNYKQKISTTQPKHDIEKDVESLVDDIKKDVESLVDDIKKDVESLVDDIMKIISSSKTIINNVRKIAIGMTKFKLFNFSLISNKYELINDDELIYYQKYIKYKTKYLELKNS